MKYIYPLHFGSLRSKSGGLFRKAGLGVRSELVWFFGFMLSFALAPFRLVREFYFGILGTPRTLFYTARDTRDWILAKV